MGDSSLHAVPFRMTIHFEKKAVMTIMSFRARAIARRGISAVISNASERSHTKCFTWDEILLFATATFRMTMFFEKKIVMRIMSFRARAIARRGIL